MTEEELGPALTVTGRALFGVLFAVQFCFALFTLLIGTFTGAETVFVQYAMWFGGLALAATSLVALGMAVSGQLFRPLLIASTALTVWCLGFVLVLLGLDG